MSTFDDPNREAIGQPPIWTGAGEPPAKSAKAKAKAEPEPEPEPTKAKAKDG